MNAYSPLSFPSVKVGQFLDALYGADPAVPLPLIDGNDSVVIDITDIAHDFENILASPLTEKGVAFVHSFASPDQAKITPTAIIRHAEDGTTVLVWAFESLTDAAKVKNLANALDMESISEAIPVPPSRGWELVSIDLDTFTSVEEMAAIYCKPEIEMYGDAVVMSPYDETDHNVPFTFTIGAGADSKNWTTVTKARGEFIAKLCKHVEGPKDGPAFVLADMVPGQRLKNSVKVLTGVGIDIDVGTPLATVYQAVKELGCLAAVYTTHSHNTTKTPIKKDSILKYIDKHGPGKRLEDNETIRWYLREAEEWDETIVSTAVYEETDHTNKGIVVIIGHAPMPKSRIVVLFRTPFEIAKEGVTQAEAMKKWVEVPLALAAKLGLPLDKSGTDPSRLFYFPRHGKGRKHETAIFGGPLFDWRTLSLEKEAIEKLADNITKGGPGKSKSKTPEGKKLGRWSVKRAHGFQIAEVITDLAPDRIRNGSGDKFEIECPWDETHSNAGDPEDKACFVANAATGQAELFTISCRHDSCHGYTNLDHLGKMIKDGWFGDEVLEDENYNAIIDDTASSDGIDELLAALSPSSTDDAVRAILVKLIERDDPLLEDRVIGEICERAKRKSRAVSKALKALRSEARDDDAAAPQPTKAEAARIEEVAHRFPVPNSSYGEFSFRCFDDTIWLYRGSVRLCTPLSYDALVTFPEDGGGEAIRLKYLTSSGHDGFIHVKAAAALRSKGVEFLALLREGGVRFTEEGEAFLTSQYKEVLPKKRVTRYRTSGWKDDGLFLTSWGEAINTNHEVELDDAAKPQGRQRAGTLAGWKDVANRVLQSGNIYMQLGLIAGFASPLLKPAGLPSMLMHFGGLTSQGKTTGECCGGSVWGEAVEKKGLVFTCDATARSYEARHEMGSGNFAAYDETHTIPPEDFHDLVYRYSSGTGTDRLNRDAKLKTFRQWSGFAVTSGEHTVAEKIRAAGRNPGTGVTTRVLEIAVDDAVKLSASEMVAIEEYKNHFGHAGPLYIRFLVAEGYARGDKLAKVIETHRLELAGVDATAARLRMARIAAVLWTAGELAQNAGLFDADINIKAIILDAWDVACSSEIAADGLMDRAIETLCTSLLMEKASVDTGSPYERNYKVRRIEKYEGDRAVYMVPTRNLAKLAGGAIGAKALAKELNNRKMLLAPKEGHCWSFVKGEGKVPSYLIWADAVEKE